VTVAPAARAVGLEAPSASRRAASAATRSVSGSDIVGAGKRGTAMSPAAALRGRVEAPPGTVRLTVVDAARRDLGRDVAPGEPFAVPVGGMTLPLVVTAAHAESAPRTIVLRRLAPLAIRLHRRPSALAGEEASETEPVASGPGGGARADGSAVRPVVEDGADVAPGAPALEGVVRLPPGAAGPATVRVGAELSFQARDGEPFRVRLEDPPLSRLVVDVEHPATLGERVTLPVYQRERGGLAVARLEVELIAARAVAGRVVREDGGALGGLPVLVYRGDAAGPLGAPRMRTTTDREGRFEVRAEGEGRFWAVAYGDAARPGAAAFDLVLRGEEGRRADRSRTEEPLDAGTYVLWIEPEDPGLQPVSRRLTLPAGVTLDVDLALGADR